MIRPICGSIALLLSTVPPLIGQVPDSIRAFRAELQCGAPEGRWALTIVLDSSSGPSYPAGRTAVGTLSLAGETAWATITPDYACNSNGEFAVDQRPLWHAALHPISKEFPRPEKKYYSRAWLYSAGGIGSDSVMIMLGGVEAGSLSMRGEWRGDVITGTWDLNTCDVCEQSSASGRFVAIRQILIHE